MAVCTFLKKNPVLSITGLLKAEDWPDDPETEPNPYLHKEIKRMLVFADQREDLLVRFFHGAGMREQEVAHAELSDINFAKKFIQVQVKPKWNWKPKTKAGTRKVPLGDALLADIQKHCSDGLLFPNPSTGRPEGHFLRLLQNLAKRAGVCGPGGKAAGCHRFRDTFATDQVRARILDLRDIAKIMGHENLDMMKLYAAYVDLESQEARNAANVSALLIQRTDAEVQVQ
jgi:integrase